MAYPIYNRVVATLLNHVFPRFKREMLVQSSISVGELTTFSGEIDIYPHEIPFLLVKSPFLRVKRHGFWLPPPGFVVWRCTPRPPESRIGAPKVEMSRLAVRWFGVQAESEDFRDRKNGHFEGIIIWRFPQMRVPLNHPF